MFAELAREDAAKNGRPDLAEQYQLAMCYRFEANLAADPIFASGKSREDCSPAELQQLAQALEPYGAARKIMEALAHQNPDVDEYQVTLAQIQLYIGQIEYYQRHTEAAVAALADAEAALRRLLADHPEDPRYLAPFIKILGYLGALRPDAVQREQTLKTLEELQRRIDEMGARKPPPAGVSALPGLIRKAIANVRSHRST